MAQSALGGKAEKEVSSAHFVPPGHHSVPVARDLEVHAVRLELHDSDVREALLACA